MKLFDGGRAPNPRRVRVFLAEKGLTVPLVPVDMGALEHREQPVASRNALRRLPVLELDDGTIITESIAICRYFEESHPEPALFGTGALGKATVEMWQRRMEFNLLSCVAAAFRHIHPAMKDWEVPQIPEWGEANKPKAIEFLYLLDRELADREFAASDAYSVADITGMIAIDFMKPARIKVPEDCTNVLRWYGALTSRPSATA
ncbi:glutathione S-transferase [Mesorhizobium sp.]|uniref:glutathione S-transferase n=1 Tax=Mesorhizobium sp. TaxID=1871066 RepID=UPI000FE7CB43|nr:glutathione S-transferase [Mesorhizobium sp.]RWM27850.1 MAG: glutathione S-transferase [Mesorhizobium sp.]RWM42667.1 MAG: glutathione S-transferase [Mesorhizobium sp.]TJV53127.1 MAG: glutathione S-transferase [Mesorhizobium sp.]